MAIVEKVQIIENNPQLKNDVKLFKVMLMPLELLVLKFFLVKIRPINIREVYTECIFMTFHNLFFEEELKSPSYSYKFLVPDLINSGYGFGIVGEAEKKKIRKKYIKEAKGISETKIRDMWLNQIKEHNSKTPSYDKIKAIFESFERLGIIHKRGKEGKGIVYRLNPYFYTAFEDKREEIIKL
jgi:hypothetical protein